MNQFNAFATLFPRSKDGLVVTIDATKHNDLLWGNEGTLIRIGIVADVTSFCIELYDLIYTVILSIEQHYITLVTVIATVARQNYDFCMIESYNGWIVSGGQYVFRNLDDLPGFFMSDSTACAFQS